MFNYESINNIIKMYVDYNMTYDSPNYEINLTNYDYEYENFTNTYSNNDLKYYSIKFISLLIFQSIIVLSFTFSSFILFYQTWFKKLDCYLSFVISIIFSLLLFMIFCAIQNYILYLIIGGFNFMIWFIIMILNIENKKERLKINNNKIYQNLS